MKLTFRLKGGAGSGHRGHAGRPGKHGGSLPGRGGAVDGDMTADITSAKKLIASQKTELANAAKSAGEQYFGKDFLYDKPTKYVVETADDRLKRNAEDVGVDWTDPEEAMYVQLIDDFEYVFVYDSTAKTSKSWATYRREEEGLTVDHFKGFYKDSAKGDFLVSYWGGEISIIVP